MLIKLDVEGPFKIVKTDPIEASLGKGKIILFLIVA